MKKKKLLFVINNLNCGGAEKSLISLLESLDYNRLDVDLFIFKHEGLFLDKIPAKVKLLPEPKNYIFFDMPIKKSTLMLIKKGNINTLINRYVLGYYSKKESNGAVIEQKVWKFLRRSIKKIPQKYDVAIGYQEKNPIYFVVDKVNAKKKVGWVHTDYNKLGISIDSDSIYLSQLDNIVTVSAELAKILKSNFLKLVSKITPIQNIVSSKLIHKMSLEENINLIEQNAKTVSLISVGRLAKEKGLDITLDALNILINKGYDIKWHIIGEGDMRLYLEQKGMELNIGSRIIFHGLKSNPYPYIKAADVFIQTSRFEGKSISIEEAKILSKPILLTNFETAKEHVINNETGIIAEMDSISVAESLERLIIDENLRRILSDNLRRENLGTENEVDKFYELLI